jgi:hypothetical protein
MMYIHTHTSMLQCAQAAQNGDASAMFQLAQLYMDTNQENKDFISTDIDELFDVQAEPEERANAGVFVDESMAKSIRKGIRQVGFVCHLWVFSMCRFFLAAKWFVCDSYIVRDRQMVGIRPMVKNIQMLKNRKMVNNSQMVKNKQIPSLRATDLAPAADSSVCVYTGVCMHDRQVGGLLLCFWMCVTNTHT